MTQLRIYATQTTGVAEDGDSAVAAAPQPLFSTSKAELISSALKTRGIKFQRWPSNPELKQGAIQDQILMAYEALISSVQEH